MAVGIFRLKGTVLDSPPTGNRGISHLDKFFPSVTYVTHLDRFLCSFAKQG
jgi:hypothetical protein